MSNTVTPKLAVLVSIYNSGEWLRSRLDNLMSVNNINDFDIWCINADSPDERDHNIAISYQAKNVHYIKLNHRNTLYEAWNYLICASNSQYITNANTDDLVAPDAYTKMIAALDTNNNAALAYCSWYVSTVAHPNWASVLYAKAKTAQPGQFRGVIKNANCGHFPVWRRSLHHKYGLFNTDFIVMADAEWWTKIYHQYDLLGHKCQYKHNEFLWIREPLGNYYYRDGQNLWNSAITDQEWQRFHNIEKEITQC